MSKDYLLPVVQFFGLNLCIQSIERNMDDIKFWKDLMATTSYKRLTYVVTEHIIFNESKFKAEFIPRSIHCASALQRPVNWKYARREITESCWEDRV